MIAVLLVLAQLPVASGNPARVDQVAPPTAGAATVQRLPVAPTKPSQAATVTQLPSTLEAVRPDGEERLAPGPAPAANNKAAADVARAIGVIRGRGQLPTPELIAREVGPEVLDSYLTQLNNGAAGVAPTAQPTPGDADKVPAGTTVIPPPGQSPSGQP